MHEATEKETWTAQFGTEEQCRTHLYKLRFPNGHKCPRCQNEKSYETKEGTYKCSQCGYKMSVRLGTVFEKSSLKLKQWYQAIYYASSVPNPGKVTIKTYQQEAGIGSNHSAATVKNVIENALQQNELRKLDGNVEVCIHSIVIADASLSLVLAGEVNKRKVGRCRGMLYANYPNDLSHFFAECILPGTKLNFPNGVGNIKTVEDMGYEWVHHSWDYSAQTIDRKASAFAAVVRNCQNLHEAQKRVYELCAEINSDYDPITFEELIKLVVALQSKSKESKKAVE